MSLLFYYIYQDTFHHDGLDDNCSSNICYIFNVHGDASWFNAFKNGSVSNAEIVQHTEINETAPYWDPESTKQWEENQINYCTSIGYSLQKLSCLYSSPELANSFLYLVLNKNTIRAGIDPENCEDIQLPYEGPEITASKYANTLLTGTIVIPDGVKYIRKGAFEGCCLIKEIIFPDSLEEIDEQAFWGCSRLERISLPKNVKRVGNCAFAICPWITELNYLNKKTNFGDHCFKGTWLANDEEIVKKMPEAF